MRRHYLEMTVQSYHFDAVISQSLDHGVDFIREQHEVAGDGCFAAAGRLEVNGLRNSHRRRNLHFIVHDLVGARNGELIDSAVYFSTLPHYLIDLLGINSEILSRSSGGGRGKRRLAQGERIMDGLGD